MAYFRAAKVSARISGHGVQGHVDETGRILRFKKEGDSLWVRISASKSLLRYIVPKGWGGKASCLCRAPLVADCNSNMTGRYIAVDGTSLTVCEVNRDEKWFSLMLISHTQSCVVLPTRSVGDRVNIEPVRRK